VKPLRFAHHETPGGSGSGGAAPLGRGSFSLRSRRGVGPAGAGLPVFPRLATTCPTTGRSLGRTRRFGERILPLSKHVDPSQRCSWWKGRRRGFGGAAAVAGEKGQRWRSSPPRSGVSRERRPFPHADSNGFWFMGWLGSATCQSAGNRLRIWQLPRNCDLGSLAHYFSVSERFSIKTVQQEVFRAGKAESLCLCSLEVFLCRG